MDIFDSAVRFVLRQEGGYVNDPSDPGGETKYGISKRSYPQVDIAGLTEQDAAGIYRRDYWQALHCDQMPAPVAMAVFDAAVNCGAPTAAMWLQEEVNGVLDIRGARPNDARLQVDGKIGPATLRAIGLVDPGRLLAALMSRRQLHYLGLAKKHPQFFRGWIGRTTDLLRVVSAAA